MNRRALWSAAAVIAVGLGAAAVELVIDDSFADAALAFVAGLIAASVAVLGISLLPRADWRGLVFGGFFVGAGILSWSYTERPLVVWSLLLAEGLLFMLWSRPWLANLRTSTRMGTAWLGVSYWILGALGALLVVHPGVAAQRIVYAGCFGLALLAVLATTRPAAERELSVGIAAAFLFALALLLLVGSGNLFTEPHVVPGTAWGKGFEYRFWGGEGLLYHPNSMAGLAMMAAIRIGPDRAFTVWQRLAATALAGFIVYTSDSRTGFVFLAAAATVHAALLLWRRTREVTGLPVYGGARRTIAAAAVPFVVLGLVLAFAGGSQFLLRERYGAQAGVSSGRVDTWKQVISEWRADTVAEKALGNADNARATVRRESSGDDIKLTIDNAAFGALRKAGVLGVMAFAFGLGLLLWNVWRRRDRAPAWYAVAVLTSLPTIATTEWLLGGTGGTLWILLATGEAYLLSVALPAATRVERPAPATATD